MLLAKSDKVRNLFNPTPTQSPPFRAKLTDVDVIQRAGVHNFRPHQEKLSFRILHKLFQVIQSPLKSEQDRSTPEQDQSKTKHRTKG